MSENKVKQEDVAKALSALRALSKGHESRGTSTTEVPRMEGESGATQVYHTPDNSDPGEWAGTREQEVADDGATDGIEENGTDYSGHALIMKGIMDKIAKGRSLTASEYSLLKGAMSKAGDPGEDRDSDDEELDKIGGEEVEVEKSLQNHAAEDDAVSKGLEVSEFLSGFANVISKSFDSLEDRMSRRQAKQLKKVTGAVSEGAEANESFNKSLASALTNLAEAVSLQGQRLDQLESTPARGPKSQQSVAAIEKSFAGRADAENLSKSQISETLVDMVQKGQASAQEVIKFESTGQITTALHAKVSAHRSGR